MDVLLVSPRRDGGWDRDAREASAALAGELASRGHRVRWICPVAPEERAPAAAPGVVLEAVGTACPPFRRVQDRLIDLPTERAVSAAVRVAPPDVVHVHGFGGGVSYLLPWLADRLGVPAVVAVPDVAEVLCHRRTLVDEVGSPCDAWDRPARCVACTRAPSVDGLGAVAARCASLCRALGPLSPFPRAADFANRLDMVVQGLASAAVVCAPAVAHDLLLRAGVPRRALLDPVPSSADAWLEVYARARAAAPEP